jgi:dihydroneopterin aldolase
VALQGMYNQIAPLSLSIDEIRAKVALGVTEEERAYPQVVNLSVTAWYTSEAALIHDTLEGLVDYRRIPTVLCEEALKIPRHVLEHLVIALAKRLLSEFPPFSAVQVSARKNVLVVGNGVRASYFLERSVMNDVSIVP